MLKIVYFPMDFINFFFQKKKKEYKFWKNVNEKYDEK